MTEEEWRDPEAASSAMPIQGVLPELRLLCCLALQPAKANLTKKYQCHRLAYCESYLRCAGGHRARKAVEALAPGEKDCLIEKLNPRWQDLAENCGREMRSGDRDWVELPEWAWWCKRRRDLSTRPQSLRSFVLGRDDSVPGVGRRTLNRAGRGARIYSRGTDI